MELFLRGLMTNMQSLSEQSNVAEKERAETERAEERAEMERAEERAEKERAEKQRLFEGVEEQSSVQEFILRELEKLLEE